MSLSSIEDVNEVDVETLSAAGATRAVDGLVVPLRQRQAFLVACASRAIAANQHNLDHAASAAEWLGKRLGVSMKSARKLLSDYKAIVCISRVEIAVRNGWISMEMGTVIARAADGDVHIALELLELASRSTVEVVQRRIQELNANDPDPEKCRKKQYASVNQHGPLLYANLCVLAKDATWFPEWQRREREALKANALLDSPLPASVAQAEAFNTFMNERGSPQTSVVFHYNIPSSDDEEPTCELVGVGPVPVSTVAHMARNPILHAVLTLKNKLAGYYENVKPDPTKPLPHFIRRAVLAHHYNTCQTDECFAVADDVDHDVARCNGGDHEIENLKSICRPHHDAKTKVDAAWTIAGIYGIDNRERRQKRKPNEVIVEDLPDTG